ncbi:MAG: MazG family protein [Ornithinimicrobium sp.]
MDHPRRLSLLVTSPRVAPGLLSHQAWQALSAADRVLARGPAEHPPGPGPARTSDNPVVDVIADCGIEVEMRAATTGEDAGVNALADSLIEEAQHRWVIWIGSPDADPGLSDALAHRLTGLPDPPELEMLIGSWDVPGSRLLDAVAVMDRLRSPGGCPWDATQTHRSLTPYLIEETYECVEALDSGDREHLLEELGDVLLQVLFHARVAAEHEDEDAFDVDDVAAGLVEKLIRRHPHVFAGGDASTPVEVEASWHQVKAAEKPEREHLLDGIPAGMPELARATKVTGRMLRAGHGAWLAQAIAASAATGIEGEYASQLLDIVVDAHGHQVDPSAALRTALRLIEARSHTDPLA